MKTQITMKRPTHTYLIKALGKGTVFLHYHLDGKTPALWMVTDVTPPYDDYVMCVNLQTGEVVEYSVNVAVRVDYNATVHTEFEQ